MTCLKRSAALRSSGTNFVPVAQAGERLERGSDFGARIARKSKDLDIAVPVDAGLGGLSFFENAMEIGATEPERAHRRSPRMLSAGQPGCSLIAQVKRRAAASQAADRIAHF